jgi:diguanylate cyclase (GGDEF)-like protein
MNSVICENKTLILKTSYSNNTNISNSLSDNYLDSVTDLPTSEIFDDRAKQTFYLSKRYGKAFGVLFLDIHNFSLITEELGVDKGNLLLNDIAKKLHGCIREIDTVSRFSDDVFIFLLPQLAQPETAAYVAQRLLLKLREPFLIENNPLTINASIGIAVYPVDGDNLNTLIDHANNALQKAKTFSDYRYNFYSEELQKMNSREIEISRILQSIDLIKQMDCYCLKQVNIATNQVVGIKVLAYINDTKLDLITQNEYQKIAEKDNTMMVIFENLMTQAIAQFTLWQKQGLTPNRLAFSVSANQIQHEEFFQCVNRVLDKTAFDPGLIAFEMSTDIFGDNMASLQESFEKLKKLNVQLSVSVFALGNLALQKITRLPITYLKLDDRSTQNLADSVDNEKILAALKKIAETMKLEMVVEGIDNEKQKNLLKDLGFTVMQGKFFGEPQKMQSFMH